MPNKFQKYIKSRLFKPKNSATTTDKKPSNSSSLSSKRFVVSGCHRRPRTLSFAVPEDQDVNSKKAAATLKDIDRFLSENFSSLYITDDDEENHAKDKRHKEDDQNDSARNLSQLCMGHVCSSSSSNDTSNKKNADIPEDCIAVIKSTTNPCDDFRKSMQEVIEMRGGNNGMVDWELMEAMLFSYLKLNDKKYSKYILSAFVDLVVDLRLKDR